VQPHLQGIEVEPARCHDHDLAIDDALLRQTFEQHFVQLRKVTVERPRVAALDIHVVLAAEHDCPEAIPFRLI
jgi:hypothetical protein